MASLSITLSDNVAQASNEVAQKLGITRTEFIRRAVMHELEDFRYKSEQSGIIQSLQAIKRSKQYSIESQAIDDELVSELPIEEDAWWMKKQS